MKKIAAFFCTSLIFIGCNRSPVVDTPAEAKTIRNIEAQWGAAFQAKDINKIVSLFASDAVLMGANMPISVGIEAIRKAQETGFSDTTILFKTYSNMVDAVEISASGDLAYARGTDRLIRNTPNGSAEEVGKWIDIYKKIDGEWKCIAAIWNSDMPLPDK